MDIGRINQMAGINYKYSADRNSQILMNTYKKMLGKQEAGLVGLFCLLNLIGISDNLTKK
ncbi:MAG: hypothetical protein NG747_14145 [Candidatus Brocadia sp.]|nr:hypothetical protein [Candidatus Brocadia sp.]